MRLRPDISKRCNHARARLRRRARAFAILEAVLCVVIAAVSISASLNALGAMARANTLRRDQSRGSLLARELLDEIMQYAYEQPNATTTTLGPEAGETRATYNDVDDFNGFSESPPATKAGTALSGFTGWSRSVVIGWTDPTNPSIIMLNESDMKKITVTVTDPAGKKTSIVAFRSRYGPYEAVPSTPTTYTSLVGIKLQIGSNSGLSAVGSVNPLNQIP